MLKRPSESARTPIVVEARFAVKDRRDCAASLSPTATEVPPAAEPSDQEVLGLIEQGNALEGDGRHAEALDRLKTDKFAFQGERAFHEKTRRGGFFVLGKSKPT